MLGVRESFRRFIEEPPDLCLESLESGRPLVDRSPARRSALLVATSAALAGVLLTAWAVLTVAPGPMERTDTASPPEVEPARHLVAFH